MNCCVMLFYIINCDMHDNKMGKGQVGILDETQCEKVPKNSNTVLLVL